MFFQDSDDSSTMGGDGEMTHDDANMGGMTDGGMADGGMTEEKEEGQE